MRIDRFFALNFVSAPRRLFCDIWPWRGTAVNPRLRSNKAVRIVLLQVEQNIMNEFPAISFNMWTKYTSYKNNLLYKFPSHLRPCGKESTKLRKTQKIGKERGNSYWENKEISGWKTHINTQELNWCVSTITDIFLNQKRVNVSSDWKRLLWLLSFHVFMCAFHLVNSSSFR